MQDELNGHVDKYLKDLKETAGVFSTLEAAALGALLGATLKRVGEKAAYTAALELPMSSGGQLLEEFVRTLVGDETRRVTGALRVGLAQGKSNRS